MTLSSTVGNTQLLQSLMVTSANALTVPAVTTTGDIQLNAQNAVTLNGAVNVGSGTVAINANTDGAGNQSFTMAAGSSITTTDATANAVQINVNGAGGGTGTAATRRYHHRFRWYAHSGNQHRWKRHGRRHHTNGRDDAQRRHGDNQPTTPAITGANIGSSGSNILTTAGTISASTGTSGVFITESDGANFTATASGRRRGRLTSTTGALNIAGATSTAREPSRSRQRRSISIPRLRDRSPDVKACNGSRQPHGELRRQRAT